METKWALFNRDGLRVEFIDTFGTLPQFEEALNRMQSSGWTVTEPTGNAKDKVCRITGFILTSSEDKKLGKFMPAVLLFSDYGQYAQATAYHEHLEQLPINLRDKSIKTWDSGSVTRDLAQKKGYFNKCDFEIILTPKLNSDGEPVTSDKGYVQYKFGGVKGAAAETVSDFTLNDVKPMNPNGPDEGDDLFATFKWHKDEEWLHIAAGIIQMGELTGDAARLVTYANKLHNESGDKKLSAISAKGGQGQYGYLVSLIDSRYGGNSHSMILSALCGVPISKDNPPGWKLKELIDWLVAPDSNKQKLDTLDKVVEFVKEVVAETEAA